MLHPLNIFPAFSKLNTRLGFHFVRNFPLHVRILMRHPISCAVQIMADFRTIITVHCRPSVAQHRQQISLDIPCIRGVVVDTFKNVMGGLDVHIPVFYTDSMNLFHNLLHLFSYFFKKIRTTQTHILEQPLLHIEITTLDN